MLAYQLIDRSLRGFLVIFELIQLVKLALVSIRRVMFSHTPRDIREMTKPGYFEYSIGQFMSNSSMFQTDAVVQLL